MPILSEHYRAEYFEFAQRSSGHTPHDLSEKLNSKYGEGWKPAFILPCPVGYLIVYERASKMFDEDTTD